MPSGAAVPDRQRAPRRSGAPAARRRVRGEPDVGHRLVEPAEARIARGAEEERLLLQEPAPALVDADEDGLEAIAVERLDHEARREERDLVLGRAPAEDDGDPEFR